MSTSRIATPAKAPSIRLPLGATTSDTQPNYSSQMIVPTADAVAAKLETEYSRDKVKVRLRSCPLLALGLLLELRNANPCDILHLSWRACLNGFGGI